MALAIPLVMAAASSAAATSTAVTVASLVAGAAATAAAYSAEVKQKRADEEYNQALRESASEKYSQLDKEERALIADGHTKSISAQKEFLKAQAQVTAMAGATGTGGRSVDLAIEDLRSGLGNRIGDITTQQTRNLDALNQTGIDVAKQASNQQRRVTQPSAFKALSKGVQTGYSTYTAGQGIVDAKRASSLASSNPIQRAKVGQIPNSSYK